jgi:hypothetical protein
LNFFDADCLAGKDTAEVDLLVSQTDSTAVVDDDNFVVEGIVDVGQSLTEAGRGLIDLGRTRIFLWLSTPCGGIELGD